MPIPRRAGEPTRATQGAGRRQPSILPQLRGSAWVSAADAEHWTPELMLAVEQATAELRTVVGQVARARQRLLGSG